MKYFYFHVINLQTTYIKIILGLLLHCTGEVIVCDEQ